LYEVVRRMMYLYMKKYHSLTGLEGVV